jgi:DNA repair exonuclease SbcCD nuclease subunit
MERGDPIKLHAPRYKTDDVFFEIYGFPFGSELTPAPHNSKNVKIAMIHTLAWSKTPPYPGAPESGNWKEIMKKLQGFDVVFAGDNHTPFIEQTSGGRTFVNCGSVMRRTADQKNHKPRIYLLYDDLDIEEIYIPIEEDVFSTDHLGVAEYRDSKIGAYVEMLRGEKFDAELSFEANLEKIMAKKETPENVKKLIWEVVDNVKCGRTNQEVA